MKKTFVMFIKRNSRFMYSQFRNKEENPVKIPAFPLHFSLARELSISYRLAYILLPSISLSLFHVRPNQINQSHFLVA